MVRQAVPSPIVCDQAGIRRANILIHLKMEVEQTNVRNGLTGPVLKTKRRRDLSVSMENDTLSVAGCYQVGG